MLKMNTIVYEFSQTNLEYKLFELQLSFEY